MGDKRILALPGAWKRRRDSLSMMHGRTMIVEVLIGSELAVEGFILMKTKRGERLRLSSLEDRGVESFENRSPLTPRRRGIEFSLVTERRLSNSEEQGRRSQTLNRGCRNGYRDVGSGAL